MTDWLKTLIKRFIFRFPSFFQFLKFSLVGVSNTLIDFLIYFILTRWVDWFRVHYLLANALAFVIAVTNSYFLNQIWTFKNQQEKKSYLKYFKFILANSFTLILVQVTLFVLVNYFSVFDLFSKILVILISVVSNFLLSKFVIFKA